MLHIIFQSLHVFLIMTTHWKYVPTKHILYVFIQNSMCLPLRCFLYIEKLKIRLPILILSLQVLLLLFIVSRFPLWLSYTLFFHWHGINSNMNSYNTHVHYKTWNYTLKRHLDFHISVSSTAKMVQEWASFCSVSTERPQLTGFQCISNVFILIKLCNMRVKHYFLYHDLPFPTAEMQDGTGSCSSPGTCTQLTAVHLWNSLPLPMKYKIHMATA